ncbi:MAG: STAS domain-containing protein [Ruminococcus sp.]|nr:STAS domain-containing protein [Ruminococcus sp.]
MIINKEINGNSAVIKPEGWLDASSAPEFSAALEGLESSITELTVDMEKLEYISSAGLRLIVAAHKQMNGALTIKNVSSEILSVFRMTGFDKRLNIV